MTLTPGTRCPECDGILTTLKKPCPSCGLLFIQGSLICSKCNETLGTHTLMCRPEARAKAGPILCPLCGMRRHRKDARVSREVCLWRQWAVQTGQAVESDPNDSGPSRSAQSQALFDKWLAAHPEIEGGSVPAERILRQRDRERNRQ